MRIRTLYLAVTTALLSAVVASIAVNLIVAQRRILEAQALDRTRVFAEGVGLIAGEAVEKQDDLLLLGYLKREVRLNPWLAQAEVTRFGHVSRFGEPARAMHTVSGAAGAGPDALRYALGFSRDAMQKEVESLLAPLVRRTFYIAAGFLALGILASILAGAFLTKHLDSLGAAAERMESGDLAAAVEPGGPREVRALGRRFNAMAKGLGALLEAKEDLLHTLSHELNTPLAGLKGYLELLKIGKLPESEQDTALETMGLAVARMEETLRSALEYFKDPAARVLRQDPLVLKRVVEEGEQVFHPVVAAKKIDLVVRPVDRRLIVVGDLELLRHVVYNLLSNAIKYTPEGGVIWVAVEEAADEIVFSVQDNGPGIPKEKREAIFHKFSRLERDRGVAGTGLGLAIVRRSVDALGARLRLHTVAGKGSKFSVHFPKGSGPRNESKYAQEAKP